MTTIEVVLLGLFVLGAYAWVIASRPRPRQISDYEWRIEMIDRAAAIIGDLDKVSVDLMGESSERAREWMREYYENEFR